MAENIATMYATIEGRDNMTPMLKKIQGELESIGKEGSKIKLNVSKGDAEKSFHAIRSEVQDTAAYITRLNAAINHLSLKGIDTSPLTRDLKLAEEQYYHFKKMLDSRDFYHREYSRMPDEGDTSKLTAGIKEQIAAYKQENETKRDSMRTSELLARAKESEIRKEAALEKAAARTAANMQKSIATTVTYEKALGRLEARLLSLYSAPNASATAKNLIPNMLREIREQQWVYRDARANPERLQDPSFWYKMHSDQSDITGRTMMVRHDAYDANAQREREIRHDEKAAEQRRIAEQKALEEIHNTRQKYLAKEEADREKARAKAEADSEKHNNKLVTEAQKAAEQRRVAALKSDEEAMKSTLKKYSEEDKAAEAAKNFKLKQFKKEAEAHRKMVEQEAKDREKLGLIPARVNTGGTEAKSLIEQKLFNEKLTQIANAPEMANLIKERNAIAAQISELASKNKALASSSVAFPDMAASYSAIIDKNVKIQQELHANINKIQARLAELDRSGRISNLETALKGFGTKTVLDSSKDRPTGTALEVQRGSYEAFWKQALEERERDMQITLKMFEKEDKLAEESKQRKIKQFLEEERIHRKSLERMAKDRDKFYSKNGMFYPANIKTGDISAVRNAIQTQITQAERELRHWKTYKGMDSYYERKKNEDLLYYNRFGSEAVRQSVVDSYDQKIAKAREAIQKVEELETRLANLRNSLNSLSHPVTTHEPPAPPSNPVPPKYKPADAQWWKETLDAQDRMKQMLHDQQRFLSGLTETGNKTSWLGEQFNMLKGYIVSAFAVDQVRQFLTNIVQIGGQLENQRIAIGAILGNRAQANEMFESIKGMAVKSPFGVLELDQATKSLTAYGYQYNELYDTLKRIADISAGAGVSMDRLMLAIGHVKAETALTGITLRQFTMANIPMLEMLSKMYTDRGNGRNVSVADVRKMISKKQVSYDDVMEVITEMTSEGGRFDDMQNVLSDSLKTKWKNLGDQMDIVYGEMAEGGPGGVLKGFASLLMLIAKNWKAVGEAAIAAGVAMGSIKLKAIVGGGLFGTTYGQYAGTSAKNFMQSAGMMDATYMNNLRIAQSYRVLNAEEQKALATKKGLSMATFKLAVEEKKLDKDTALRLIALKRLNAEQIKHLQLTLKLSAAEVATAQSARAATVSWAGFAASMRIVGMAVKSFFMSFVPMVAIFAVFEAGFAIFNKLSDRTKRAEDNIKAATEAYTTLQEKIAEFSGNNKPTTDIGLKNAIEEYKNVLKDYGVLSKELNDKIFGTRTEGDFEIPVMKAAEQYRALYEELLYVDGIMKHIAENGNMFDNADEKTGWWFDDTLGENVKDASDAWKEFVKELNGSDLKKYEEVMRKVMSVSSDFAKEVRELHIEKDIAKQIKLLQTERYKALREAVNDWGYGNNFFGAKSYHDAFGTMKDDVKDFADDVKQRMSNAFSNIDFSHLTRRQHQYLDTSYKMWIKQFGDISTEVQEELRKIFEKEHNLRISVTVTEGSPADPVWKQAQRKFALGNAEAEALINNIKDLSELPEAVQKRYKELDAARKAYEGRYKRSNDPIERMELYAMIQDADDEIAALKNIAKNNGFDVAGKIKKPSDKDTQLEEWRRLFELLKQVNSEYEKYVKMYDKDTALTKLDEMGDFSDLVKFIKNGKADKIVDLSNYSDMAKDFYDLTVNRIPKSASEARKKYLQQVQKYYLDMALKNEEEIADKRIRLREQEIDEEQRRWDRFSKLRTSLGDTGAAKLALGENYSSIYYKRVKRKGGDVSYEDVKTNAQQIEELNVLKSNYEISLKDYEKQLESASESTKKGLEGTVQSIKDTIASITKQLFELQQGHEQNLQNVNVAGFQKEFTFDREKILRTWVEGIIGSDGKFRSAEELYKMDKKERDNLFTKEQNAELDKRLNAWFNAVIKKAEDMDQVITEISNKTKNLEKAGKIILNNAKEQKYKLGSQSDEIIFGDVTYGDIIDQEAKSKILKMSKEYALFFNYALTLTADEVKSTIAKVKENIRQNFKKGLLTPEEYAKEMRRVSDAEHAFKYNPNGLFGSKSDLGVFASKGLQGILDKRKQETDAALLDKGEDSQEYKKAREREDASQKWTDGLNTATDAVNIVSGVFNGLSRAANALTDMFYALGDKGAGDQWSDIADGIYGVSSIFAPVNGILGSAMRGDVSGVVSNAIAAPVEMFTGPITAFAKLGDKKLQRQIEELQRQNKILANIETNTKRQMERNAGGAYTSEGAYGTMKGSVNSQLANTRRMLQAERDKKDSDDAAIEDYKQQIADLTDRARYFARDFASELYGIDFKGWAGNLANALVEAWKTGTNAARAYKDAVADMMMQVATSVLQQKYITSMIEPYLDAIWADIDANGGKITNFDNIARLGDAAQQAADMTYIMLQSIEDGLNANGMTGRGKATGLSPAIAGVTEDTASLLGAYINEMRLDVSMSNEYLAIVADQIPMAVNSLATIQSDIATIKDNTARSANASESIESIFSSVLDGTGSRKLRIAMA
jgi:hypothetical protein